MKIDYPKAEQDRAQCLLFFFVLLLHHTTYLSRHFPHRNLPLSFKPASNHFCRIPNLLSPPPLSLLALLSTWTPPSFTSSLYQFYHISSHPPQENLSLSHTHSPPPPHPSPCVPVSGHQGGRFITATWLQTLPCTRTYTHIYTHTLAEYNQSDKDKQNLEAHLGECAWNNLLPLQYSF